VNEAEELRENILKENGPPPEGAELVVEELTVRLIYDENNKYHLGYLAKCESFLSRRK